MNITMLSLIIWAALFVKSCNSEVGFTVEGDHWLNDGSVPDSKTKLKDFIDTLRSEYEKIYRLQDAKAMAEKHTDDCVHIHQDLGILRGKEDVQKGYQKLFDSGKASVKIEYLEASDMGTLGDDYFHIMNREHFYDKDDNKTGESTVLVIFKHVEDGYKHYLKAEITDFTDTFLKLDRRFGHIIPDDW